MRHNRARRNRFTWCFSGTFSFRDKSSVGRRHRLGCKGIWMFARKDRRTRNPHREARAMLLLRKISPFSRNRRLCQPGFQRTFRLLNLSVKRLWRSTIAVRKASTKAIANGRARRARQRRVFVQVIDALAPMTLPPQPMVVRLAKSVSSRRVERVELKVVAVTPPRAEAANRQTAFR